jgi:hypothetical protein
VGVLRSLGVDVDGRLVDGVRHWLLRGAEGSVRVIEPTRQPPLVGADSGRARPTMGELLAGASTGVNGLTRQLRVNVLELALQKREFRPA